MTMRDQFTKDAADALAWCRTHPVIIFLVLSALVIFAMGLWTGRLL